jgi:hypothetical protein
MASDYGIRMNHDVHRLSYIASRLSKQCLHSVVRQKELGELVLLIWCWNGMGCTEFVDSLMKITPKTLWTINFTLHGRMPHGDKVC